MGCCFSKAEDMDSKRKGQKRILGVQGLIEENPKPRKRAKKKQIVTINAKDVCEISDDEVVIVNQVKKENSKFDFQMPSSSKSTVECDDNICIIFDKLRNWRAEDVISEQADIRRNIAHNVIQLFDQDCTIPFIARYRREMTGGLDAEKLREVQEAYANVKAVTKKVETIGKTLSKEHKLDQSLAKALSNATTLSEVEHLYAPFKPGSKKSLAQKARALGLEESALRILFNQATPMDKNPMNYVNNKIKDLDKGDKIFLHWQHIMADVMSKEPLVLDLVKTHYNNENIEVTASKSNAAEKQDQQAQAEGTSTNNFKFEHYFNFKSRVSRMDSHQVLALNRGEKQKVLSVKVVVPDFIRSSIKNCCSNCFPHSYAEPFLNKLLQDTIDDTYQRLIEPLICRHVRSDLTKMAEKSSVKIFCSNLKQLLLSPPVRGHTVLGIDPGFSHGCKLAVTSSKGDVLSTQVLYLHGKKACTYSNEAQALKQCLLTFGVEMIALGNGTACRETETFLSKLIKEDYFKPLKVQYCIVDESGVSIYSVSKDAEAELPNLDPNLRSAVALARRLQDPLLEYVKIEPKNLGVGQYQHDIPETMLKTALEEVMIECVSFVGLDLNVASEAILKKVSGLTLARAKSIIQWREANGFFKNRKQLLEVKGLGPKTFEQCAGFVKIIPQTSQDLFEAKISSKKKKPNEENHFNPLDMTVIHPESYKAAEVFLSILEIPVSDIGTECAIKKVEEYLKNHSIDSLAEIICIPTSTMQLIGDALKQSVTYDIRSEMGQPLFKSGVMQFEELKIGQKLTGRIQNNTSFGAFVDVGVGISGLIHKSQMRYQELLVGDRVEVEVLSMEFTKKRLGLKLCSKGISNDSTKDSKRVKTEPCSNYKSSDKIHNEISDLISKGNGDKSSSSLNQSRNQGNSSNVQFRGRDSSNYQFELCLGQVKQGTVKSVKHFGAFVDMGIDKDGLIHNSNMNGHRLREGDKVRVKVTNIDYLRSRIALSLLTKI